MTKPRHTQLMELIRAYTHWVEKYGSKSPTSRTSRDLLVSYIEMLMSGDPDSLRACQFHDAYGLSIAFLAEKIGVPFHENPGCAIEWIKLKGGPISQKEIERLVYEYTPFKVFNERVLELHKHWKKTKKKP